MGFKTHCFLLLIPASQMKQKVFQHRKFYYYIRYKQDMDTSCYAVMVILYVTNNYVSNECSLMNIFQVL